MMLCSGVMELAVRDRPELIGGTDHTKEGISLGTMPAGPALWLLPRVSQEGPLNILYYLIYLFLGNVL